jgi:hypothetical protein
MPTVQGRHALPSLRYMKLIREGAADFGLAPDYQAWLAGLQHYVAERPGQKLGALLFKAFAFLFIFPVWAGELTVTLPAVSAPVACQLSTVLAVGGVLGLLFAAFATRDCADKSGDGSIALHPPCCRRAPVASRDRHSGDLRHRRCGTLDARLHSHRVPPRVIGA